MYRSFVWTLAAIVTSLAATACAAGPDLKDGIRITESTKIPAGTYRVIDAAQDGAIFIEGDGITVDFQNAQIQGNPDGQAQDEFAGTGVIIQGKNITVRNLKVSGYKVGIHARQCTGLTLEDADISGNYAKHLASTPEAEDGSDWFFPHNNEEQGWIKQYGGGLYVEDSKGATIRRVRARHGQHGILIDCVNDSKIYDCDCSFLTGWGLGMWRSNRNVITRNAFDFCIRGYSHGVYNRGQDSAGILMFEQNSDNVIAENSVTHGGDGFFGFAGREALGETPPPAAAFDYTRRGNNGNLLIRNDFSYAPAHGIEMTFSFGNKFIENRMVENAICGIWGGYSQDTLVMGNLFEANGQMGYGLERGGVNIEHGRDNVIVRNTFRNNRCGVHLWWDDDGALLKTAWSRANDPASRDNVIAENTFEGDELVLHLRECGRTVFADNTIRDVKKETVIEKSPEPVAEKPDPAGWNVPEYPVYGETRPVGARKNLRGRDKIIVTEWGPYDWQAPYLHFIGPAEGGHQFRLLGTEAIVKSAVKGDASLAVTKSPDAPFPMLLVTPTRENAVTPYELEIRTDSRTFTHRDALIMARWTVRVFAYETDPREDVDAWHKEAADALEFELPSLDLKYGGGGPSDLPGAPAGIRDAKLPREHFGTIATTSVTFPPGRWQIITNSDDGIRVWADGKLVIDDWTWHAPKKHDAELSFDKATTVELRVEHFELDGYAILTFEIKSVRDSAAK